MNSSVSSIQVNIEKCEVENNMKITTSNHSFFKICRVVTTRSTSLLRSRSLSLAGHRSALSLNNQQNPASKCLAFFRPDLDSNTRTVSNGFFRSGIPLRLQEPNSLRGFLSGGLWVQESNSKPGLLLVEVRPVWPVFDNEEGLVIGF